jgi:endonuclease/exonuclease/phosphatase family metal-dependent hydrolase
MRVASLNVCARHADWPKRREVLRDGFATLRPDVVALQETVATAAYDQVADILGDVLQIVHQGRREADGTGCSIASRWPITDTHEFELPSTDRPDDAEFVARSTIVEIAGPDGPFLLAHHKPSWRPGYEQERELESVTLADRIDQVLGDRDLPVVLAGDFDAEPTAASIRFWTGRQSLHGRSVAYRDAWELAHPGEPGPTFANENPLMFQRWGGDLDRRIDYVFVQFRVRGPGLKVVSCDRIFDRPVDGVWASDHYGVYADLAWPGEQG